MKEKQKKLMAQLAKRRLLPDRTPGLDLHLSPRLGPATLSNRLRSASGQGAARSKVTLPRLKCLEDDKTPEIDK